MLLDIDAKRSSLISAIWLLLDRRFGPTRTERVRVCIKNQSKIRHTSPQVLCLQSILDVAAYAPNAALSMLDTVDRLRDTIKSKHHADSLNNDRARKKHFQQKYRQRIKDALLIHEWEKKNKTHDVKAKLTLSEREAAQVLIQREFKAKRDLVMQAHFEECKRTGATPSPMQAIRQATTEIEEAIAEGIKAQKKQFFDWSRHQKTSKSINSLKDLDKFDN